jgi:SAM-dependent methyltransferase
VTVLDRVRAHYEGSLAEHGASARGVGWPDADGQALRFELLARVLDGVTEPVRVADLGCGYGALFAFLDARIAVYRGYDVSPAMVAEARRRVADPRAVFVVADRPDQGADFGFASGTFNVRLGADEAEWDGYVRESLRRLWACCARGMAFNLMTTEVDWRSDDLFYADPGEYVAFCRRELSRHVTLQRDYGLYEWTMTVLRS